MMAFPIVSIFQVHSQGNGQPSDIVEDICPRCMIVGAELKPHGCKASFLTTQPAMSVLHFIIKAAQMLSFNILLIHNSCSLFECQRVLFSVK